MRYGNRKVHKDDSRLHIAVIILVVFFIAATIGALLCNGLYGSKTSELGLELQTFFSDIRENGVNAKGDFLMVYFKYLKYSLFIWGGGWLAYGIPISGLVLCFRGISLGFTTSMLLRTYGFKGFFAIFLTILPQNIILIPVYICLTWASACFWFRRRHALNGKASLRREKQKQYTEYSIFLGGALILTAVATLVETILIPLLMESAALFLV